MPRNLRGIFLSLILPLNLRLRSKRRSRKCFGDLGAPLLEIRARVFFRAASRRARVGAARPPARRPDPRAKMKNENAKPTPQPPRERRRELQAGRTHENARHQNQNGTRENAQNSSQA